MNILERFPYLSKCCLCINLRTGCLLVGFVSIIFHLTFVIIRDITILVSVKKSSEQRTYDTSSHIMFLVLLLQTICVRIPGLLSCCCTIVGALMESIFILKISVWTNLYILICIGVGVVLFIIQLFIEPIAVFVLIILFDLLLFVFLQYFFLIINSFYQYLLQIKQIEQHESCYVTYFPAAKKIEL